MAKAILLAVDEEAKALEGIERELRKRYGADYEVICELSATEALRKLENLKATGADVAVLLADLWMPEMSGVDFLTRAHNIHPHAKRAPLINWWGNRSMMEILLQAMALNQIDVYAGKPGEAPDEEFHKVITDFLQDWARIHRPTSQVVQVVGEQWALRSHELRDLFERNNIPYQFFDMHTDEGQALHQEHRPEGPFPLVVFFDGRVLADPSNEELADAFEVNTQVGGTVYDLTIIGAGPAGLSAAVYGASEGLRTIVVECEAIGGQAGTTSLIRLSRLPAGHQRRAAG